MYVHPPGVVGDVSEPDPRDDMCTQAPGAIELPRGVVKEVATMLETFCMAGKSAEVRAMRLMYGFGTPLRLMWCGGARVSSMH